MQRSSNKMAEKKLGKSNRGGPVCNFLMEDGRLKNDK
jgi:hypothetical protein